MRSPSTRFRIEAALGRAGLALLALTLVMPDWIETLFDLAPDAGRGSAEWGLVLTIAILTIVFYVSAVRTARRQATIEAAGAVGEPPENRLHHPREP